MPISPCWFCVFMESLLLQDVTSWREGGGRNLQPSSLTLSLPADPEGKITALGETGTPPASSHPPSTTGTTSCSVVTAQSPVLDPKEPSLRPAQPIRRTTVPTALQYQLHHTSTAVYHDMLPAFVSTMTPSEHFFCKLFRRQSTEFKISCSQFCISAMNIGFFFPLLFSDVL